MKTTLDIEASVLEAAKAVAAQTSRSVGAVISDWAKRGATNTGKLGKRGDVPVFKVPKNAPPIDPEVVREIMNNEGFFWLSAGRIIRTTTSLTNGFSRIAPRDGRLVRSRN